MRICRMPRSFDVDPTLGRENACCCQLSDRQESPRDRIAPGFGRASAFAGAAVASARRGAASGWARPAEPLLCVEGPGSLVPQGSRRSAATTLNRFPAELRRGRGQARLCPPAPPSPRQTTATFAGPAGREAGRAAGGPRRPSESVSGRRRRRSRGCS